MFCMTFDHSDNQRGFKPNRSGLHRGQSKLKTPTTVELYFELIQSLQADQWGDIWPQDMYPLLQTTLLFSEQDQFIFFFHTPCVTAQCHWYQPPKNCPISHFYRKRENIFVFVFKVVLVHFCLNYKRTTVELIRKLLERRGMTRRKGHGLDSYSRRCRRNHSLWILDTELNLVLKVHMLSSRHEHTAGKLWQVWHFFFYSNKITLVPSLCYRWMLPMSRRKGSNQEILVNLANMTLRQWTLHLR